MKSLLALILFVGVAAQAQENSGPVTSFAGQEKYLIVSCKTQDVGAQSGDMAQSFEIVNGEILAINSASSNNGEEVVSSAYNTVGNDCYIGLTPEALAILENAKSSARNSKTLGTSNQKSSQSNVKGTLNALN